MCDEHVFTSDSMSSYYNSFKMYTCLFNGWGQFICRSGMRLNFRIELNFYLFFRYEGEFSQGWFHGYGVFWRTDGTHHEGEFRGGKIYGLGKFMK